MKKNLFLSMLAVLAISVFGFGGISLADDNVARIGDGECGEEGTSCYNSLQSAVDAANSGDTVTLLTDITLNESVQISKAIVIDGNGKELVFDSSFKTPFNYSAGNEGIGTGLIVKNLTITNNGAAGGYAVIAGKGTEVYDIEFDNCVFNNLWCAVMLNGCNGTFAPSVNVHDSSFINTKWGVSFYQEDYINLFSFESNTGLVEGHAKELFGCDEPLVKIGDEYYCSLQSAVDAANSGDTVTLLKDVALISTLEIIKDVTLDLNGKNITATDVRAIYVKNGNAKITGEGTISANGENLASSSSVIRVGDGSDNNASAKLTIDEKVTVASSKCFGVTVFGKNDIDNDKMTSNIELVINGTVVVSGTEAAVSDNGSVGLSATTITIDSSANISAENDYAIYHPGKGVLTINGVVIGKGGIETKGGEVVVNDDAKISSNSTDITHDKNNNGPSSAGYAIAAVSNNNYPGNPKVTINGGIISGDIIALDDDSETSGAYIEIKGGIFNSLLAINYGATAITLSSDVELSESINAEGKNIEIEGNGHTITFGHTVFNHYDPNIEGLKQGSISVSNTNFISTGNGYIATLGQALDDGDYVGSIALDNCTFKDMYTVIYSNKLGSAGNISITNNTFDNVEWGYSVDQPRQSAKDDINVVFENNTGLESGHEKELFNDAEPVKYVITFNTDGGSEIAAIEGIYGSAISVNNPTKAGYTFVGWNPELPATMPAKDLTVTAQWTKNGYSGGGSAGGGGSSKKEDVELKGEVALSGDLATITDDKVSNEDTEIKDVITVLDNEGNAEKTEMQLAYEFAYANGITTMDTYEKANMEGTLTRIAMAKMLSQYAINVLGKTPDTGRNATFTDVTAQMDADYNNGVTLAYQLGIMGVNLENGKYRPNDLVTRAEFGTALSRLLFGTEDGNDAYYSTHLAKLAEEGIITNTNASLQELRGYVMIMLMRSANASVNEEEANVESDTEEETNAEEETNVEEEQNEEENAEEVEVSGASDEEQTTDEANAEENIENTETAE